MRHIDALSLKAYSWGMSTDLLNPSPYKLRKVDDKGSLSASTQSIEFFSREKIEDSAWLTYGKPVRAVARALYTIGVSVLVAPIGLVYHSASALTHSFMMLQGEDAAHENWQKVKQHTFAFFRDLIVGCSATLSAAYTAVGLTISPFYLFPGALLNITPIANGIWPRFMAELWHMADQKAHIFRDEFGLVNQNSGLLTIDATEDHEDLQLNGQLGLLWQDRCQKLLDTVQAIQDGAIQQPTAWPPNGRVIARNMPQDVSLKIGERLVSAKSYLKCLQIEIDAARDILKECLEADYERKKFNKEYYVEVPDFPFSRPAAQ